MRDIFSFSVVLSFLFSIALSWNSVSAAPVAVGIAEQKNIVREVYLTGTVTAPEVAALSTAIEGMVNSVLVDAGSWVKPGDILLTLNDDLARLQLASAQAGVSEAENNLKDAERRLREGQELVPQRSISRSEVRALEAEVSLKTATLQQAKAQAKVRAAVVIRHEVKAPFSGIISQKLVEQGEWIRPGDQIVELVAMENLRIDFEVAEDYLPLVNPSTQVEFTLNADPKGTIHQGAENTIVPITDPRARTFLFRVKIKNNERDIFPGMSVKATLFVPTGREGVVVPRDATLRYPDGRIVVWTVQEADGKSTVKENVVNTGLSFGRWVEISKGLDNGVRVVIEGNEALQDGQSVEVVSSITK